MAEYSTVTITALAPVIINDIRSTIHPTTTPLLNPADENLPVTITTKQFITQEVGSTTITVRTEVTVPGVAGLESEMEVLLSPVNISATKGEKEPLDVFPVLIKPQGGFESVIVNAASNAAASVKSIGTTIFGGKKVDPSSEVVERVDPSSEVVERVDPSSEVVERVDPSSEVVERVDQRRGGGRGGRRG